MCAKNVIYIEFENVAHGKEVRTLKKYLSDVIDMNLILSADIGNKICIVSGVGSGKSSWVVNRLGECGRVLFITSRRAKVDEDLSNKSNVLTLYREELITQKHTIATNAKIATIISEYNINGLSIEELLEPYTYIVLDEAHSIATDSTFTDSSSIIMSFIEKASKLKKTFLLTGTLEPINKYLIANEWKIFDYMDECHNVMAQEIHLRSKRDALKRVNSLIKEHKKVIYFANSASDIINNLYQKDANNGVIISDMGKFYKKYSDSHIKKDMENLYNSIVKNQLIPNDIDILYSTSKLKEGVNINNDDIMEVFCESHDMSDIIQFIGRVRKGCLKVNIITDAIPHDIFINEIEYLFAKEKLVKAANEYMEENYSIDNDILDIGRKDSFIDYIMKSNQYIFFDYVTNNFRLNQLKYDEQTRKMNNEKNWKNKLLEYCIDNNINLIDWGKNIKKCIYNSYEKMAKGDVKLIGQDKIKRYLEIVAQTYRLPNKKLDVINKYLQDNSIKYKLEKHKIRSGKDKDKYELVVTKMK